MSFETVLYDVSGGVATVTLDRPDRLNAWNTRLGAELGEAMATAAEDEAIAAADTVLLTVPNQLGVEYNQHLLETVLRDVAPGLGWR